MTYFTFFNQGSGVSSAATANNVGNWTQFLSATAIAATSTISAIHFQAIGWTQTTNTDNSMLLDIGKGAAGSETVIVPDIAIGGANNSGGQGPCLLLPVRVPGATRLAVRVRAATASRGILLTNILTSGVTSALPFVDRLPLSLETLGTSQSTSAGTAMSGSSGTWTQITASTSTDYQALILVPSTPASGTGYTQTVWQLDLGIGAAGSEVPVAYQQGFYTSSGFCVPNNMAMPSSIYGGFVPAGTRIAVRHNLAANPERVCACVIGVPYV